MIPLASLALFVGSLLVALPLRAQSEDRPERRDALWVYYGGASLPNDKNDGHTSENFGEGEAIAIGFERTYRRFLAAELRALWGWAEAPYPITPRMMLSRYDAELHIGIVPPIPWVKPYLGVGGGVFHTELPANGTTPARSYVGIRPLVSIGLRISLGHRAMARGDMRFSSGDGAYGEYDFGVRQAQVGVGIRF